jgi:DNA-binding winged helix-turn-helix (wHTH) protein
VAGHRVSEDNLKVQVSVLRKALGADRDVVGTEFGRGYRFTGVVRSSAAPNARRYPARTRLRSSRPLFPQHCRQPLGRSFGSS